MINRLEVLVEEQSMDIALRLLLPRIVPDVDFEIHVFRGKPDLLKKLTARLKGFRSWMSENTGVVVIVDRDNDDCGKLKGEIEAAAKAARLITKTACGKRNYQMLNRIAVEELEAWFFGDVAALSAAYPGVPTSIASRKGCRDPDSISGGTAEAMERVLQRAGHFQGGLAKTRAARAIATHMDVDVNRSPSFCALRDGLRAMVNQGDK